MFSGRCCILTATYLSAVLLGTAGVGQAQTSLTWTGGGTDSNWTTVANWGGSAYPNNGQPDAGDTYNATINSGAPTLNANIAVNAFTLGGADLLGSANLTVNGPFLWSGGVISDSGSINLNGGGTLVGSLYVYANLGRTGSVTSIANSGTITLNGSLSSSSSAIPASWLNKVGATFTLIGDSGMNQNLGSFDNRGTFQKVSGTGTSFVNWNFANFGTVIVQSGTLDFSGGSPNLYIPNGSSRYTLQGPATYRVLSGATFSIAGLPISVINTDVNVELNGPGSNFIGLDSLMSIGNSSDHSNSLSILGGAAYIPRFTLTNFGTLTVGQAAGDGSQFNGGLNVGSGGLLRGSGAVAGTVTVSAGGTVSANGFNFTVGSLAGTAGTCNNGAAGPGSLTVGTDNTSTTYGGTIADGGTGSLALVKVGSGTLTLGNGSNTFSGGITVLNGTVQIATDAALGTGNVTGASLGTLAFTGTTATAKSFAMNGGTIAIAAGQTVTFNGSQVTSATLDGSGTFATNGAIVVNATTTASVVIASNSAKDQFVHFDNSGTFNVAAGVNALGNGIANLNGFTSEGSGSVMLGAGSAVNVANFQTYGTLAMLPSTSSAPTVLTNIGTAPLGFNGGSRTFIGTPQTAAPTGQNVVDYIDLHGQNAIVTGGLFVNNGGVYDTVGSGTGTIIADYGALVKGAGFYQNTVKTQNGGKFQTGNSPGSATFGNFVFGPGGVNNYIFAIDDATGTAGPSPNASGLVSGWGLIKAVQVALAVETTSGNFIWTATPSNPLTVSIDTLVNPTMVGTDVAGPMADFNPNQSYSWTAARWMGTYSGPTDGVTLDADTSFDTSGFVNPIRGTFGWALDTSNQTLSLVYTPSAVPEPSSLALAGLGAASWVAFRRRRPARGTR